MKVGVKRDDAEAGFACVLDEGFVSCRSQPDFANMDHIDPGFTEDGCR
jgi:hypothetical protein